MLQYFTLYLKGTHMYSVQQYNSIPTAMNAVNWLVMVSSGFVVDKIGRRGPGEFGWSFAVQMELC